MNNFYQQAPYAYMGNGMVPNQAAQAPKTMNWLSPEKISLLQKNLSQFKLSVTEEEMAKAQCNHYSNGVPTLEPDKDGSGGCTCTICGTHFNSRDYSQEEVENATQNVLDILNTIKIMYLSIDPSAALEYFQIIAFIEKIPQLYTIATNDFKKYEGVNQFNPASNANPFNIFNMMTNPGLGMGMAQPMYNPQAQMYGQPMYQQPNAGYAQVNPQFNPMYGQPQAQGYQPQANGFAMNPMGAAAPQQGFNTNMPNAANPTGAAQATPAAETPVTVDAKFKK